MRTATSNLPSGQIAVGDGATQKYTDQEYIEGISTQVQEATAIRTVSAASASIAARRRAGRTETHLGTVRRARKINRILGQTYPYAVAELDFSNPFELLVATVLSAQTTDVRVNSVTGALFTRYPNAHALAAATEEEVQPYIRALGFYRAKARSIVTLSRQLVSEHDGRVPDTLEELVTLAGVGRKTAFVVLGNAFGQPGLTVDTHFGAWPVAWGSAPTPTRPLLSAMWPG